MYKKTKNFDMGKTSRLEKAIVAGGIFVVGALASKIGADHCLYSDKGIIDILLPGVGILVREAGARILQYGGTTVSAVLAGIYYKKKH